MNFFDLFIKHFFYNNKCIIIIFIIISCLLLLSEYILTPIVYSKIIMSLNLNKFNKFNHQFYILIGIWVFILCLVFIKGKCTEKIFPSYIKYIRTKLINLTLENNINNFSEIKIGNHILRIVFDSWDFSDGIEEFLREFVPSFIGILMITFYISIINLKIGLFLLFSYILSIFIIYLNYKKYIQLTIKQVNYFYDNIDKINSKFSNLSNIYINNQKEEEINISNNDQNEYKNILMERLNLNNNLILILYIISIFSYLLTIFIGFSFFQNNLISKQNYILILIILTYLIGLIFKIITILPSCLYKIGGGISSTLYFKNFLNNNNYKKNNLKINSGSIKIINLSYSYQNNMDKKYIFDNINLDIKSGDKIAIYGRSGFGKSTLAKLILNLYNYEGKIYLDNQDIKLIDNNILRTNIIYVNQKTELFDDSIFENIKYGNKINKEDILQIINKYKLNNIFDNVKQNYNTNCGIRGNNLSLGMQKIIILLRAYFKFKDAKVIILDEPLAGLDYLTKKKILKFIKDIDKEKTILIITHDEEIFTIVDKRINIESLTENS